MVGLKSSSVPCTERSTAKQHMDRCSKRCSKRGGYREKHEKDI